MLCSNLFHKYIFNKITCLDLTELLIEFYDNEVIHFCFFQKDNFLFYSCQKCEINIFLLKYQSWMR